MILSSWILKFVFMWPLSHIACNVVEKLNIVDFGDAELVASNISPSTHMEITDAKRFTRSSEFERGYEEFLRNYNHDNNINNHGDPHHADHAADQGNYRVEESDENVPSYANDEGSADDDGDDEEEEEEEEEESGSESSEPAEINEGYVEYDTDSGSGGSDSVESNEKRKNYKTKPQIKKKGRSLKKSENVRSRPKKTKPKKKRCKKERRDNMLCTICYDPKSDEKSESCSYSSEPKEHNYAYTEDSSFGGKDKEKEREREREPESLEASDSDEDDNESEGQTIKPERKNPPSNKYPVYNNSKPKRANGKYYPSPPPHQKNRKFGPQTFDIPQSFRVAQSKGRPSSRYQTKKSPKQPNVTLIRYHTVENPFTSERIRLIVPAAAPLKPQNRPKQQKLQNNRLPPDVRPPREVNGAAQSESLLSNVTKEHEFEYLPSHLNDEASRHSVTFTNKDGLKCKKSIDGNKVCFECVVDGERRKECMFSKTHKPTHFFESYTTSKKSKHSLGSLNPLEYDSTSETIPSPGPSPTPKPKPKPKPKQHLHSQVKNKPKLHLVKPIKNNKKHVKIDEQPSISPISKELVFPSVEKALAETEADWSLSPNPKPKQKQPETEIEWSLNPSIKPKPQQKQQLKKQPETEIEWSLNRNIKSKQLDTEIDWDENQNIKAQKQPIKSQPIRAVPEVIYGTPQPDTESYTILYNQPEPIKFIADTSSRTIHI